MNRMLSVCSLALLAVACGSVRAQPDRLMSATEATAMPLTASMPLSKSGPELSSWIQGTDPDCCGSIGDQTPLQTELFLRTGWAVPEGGGILEENLEVGWTIQGGFRALFFNDRGDSAWSLEAHLINIHQSAKNPPLNSFFLFDQDVGDNVFGDPIILRRVRVSLQTYNRTLVGVGGGREWYLLGSAAGTRSDDGARWRFGVDGGGRWGTAKADLNELPHLTDTIAAVYAAAHTDFDLPCGCCIFHVGFRTEWDYTWSDILQFQNSSDVQDISMLLNFGVRY